MEELLAHIEFIQKTSTETCNFLKGKELTDTQKFCFGIIERLNFGTVSMKPLLIEFDKDARFDFSLGLITRCLLLDTLIIMNLFKIIDDAEKQKKSIAEIEELVNEFCEIVLSDGLSNTFIYLENIHKHGAINDEQLKLSFNNLANEYKQFLKPHLNDGTKPLLKTNKFFSPKSLFENLANSKNLKSLMSLYDSYLYFSKYDHFGVLYFQALAAPKEDKLKYYSEAVISYLANQHVVYVVLARYFKDNFINSQYQIVGDYFEKVVKYRS